MNAARQRLEAHREAKKQKEQAESVNEEKKQVCQQNLLFYLSNSGWENPNL